MAVEVESVMQRLDAQTKLLQQKILAAQPAAPDEATLTLSSLALVSEALLKIGRDVRHLRNQLADTAVGA